MKLDNEFKKELKSVIQKYEKKEISKSEYLAIMIQLYEIYYYSREEKGSN